MAIRVTASVDHRSHKPIVLMGVIGLLGALSLILLVLWLTNAHLPPAGTGAVAGAAISGIIAIALAALGYADRRADARERELERIEDYMIQSFHFFIGGTQRRGVGVSAVEGLLSQVPNLRGVFVPLLVNQAIYVLTKVPEVAGEKALTDHEKDNLDRMIAVLSDELRLGDTEHAPHYAKLATEIRRKSERVNDRPTRRWLETLGGWLTPGGTTPIERSSQ